MIIADNMLANGAARQLKIIGTNKKKPTERLSSGYRINRASDDAAGLSISEKMRGQIRGLTRASQNVQDGISFIQTGDGALEEVQSMLQRIRELAVQASNDTNTEDDRASIDKEVQQLKDEMDRLFNESEFNTIPIFHAPYIPDIEGMPSDFEFYNTPDGLGVEGILINHKRYTPLELGYPTTPEHDDWELEFTDDNGELIHLKLSANEPFSKMHRIYQYEADETGIKINNLYATTWDTINQDDNIYSFSYHGMNISFTAEAGDTLDDMINKINGDGSVIKSMEAIPIGQSVPTTAVNREGGSMAVYVTNSNKNSIGNWNYKMIADDNGIHLREIYRRDGITHSRLAWSEILGGPSSISDWGTPDEISDESALTSVSNGSHYYYQDFAVLGKPNYFYELYSQFSFNVDEVSLEQAKQALTFDLYGDTVEAPIDEVRCDVPFWNSITNDYSYAFLCTGYENFDSFEFQRDYLLRDFGKNGSEAPMSVSVRRTLNVIGSETDYRQEGDKWVENKTYDVCTYSYSVINSSGIEIMTGTSDSFLNTRSIYTYADTNITIHTETGDSLIRETEKSDKALKITLTDNDGFNVSLSLDYNRLRPYASNPNANEFNTVPVTVLPAYEAMRYFYSDVGTAGIATETNLTVKVNPPKKLLHIQAGANAGQNIDIEWPALSNSILGIGGIKTDTFASSQYTISATDEAISMVSDVRSTFGAYQNRLEHAQNVDQNTAENLQNAESRIRDADMAKEIMENAKQSILEQVGQSMITQANQNTQGILKLLQ